LDSEIIERAGQGQERPQQLLGGGHHIFRDELLENPTGDRALTHTIRERTGENGVSALRA